VAGAELNRAVIAQRLDRGYLDATTLMEHLIGRGIPQRTAHGLIGQLVAKARKQDVPLAELTLADFQEADPSLDESVFDVLGVENAVRAMKSYGSTGPEMVKEQVARWTERLRKEG
jgi:argininosuccinate lyase